MEAVYYFLQNGGKLLPVCPASHLGTLTLNIAGRAIRLSGFVACRMHLDWFLAFLTFLGAFAKLRNATVSFVRYARPEQLGSQWTDFNEI